MPDVRAPAPPPPVALRRFGSPRVALVWERLWPALWPGAGVIGAFLALALFDLPARLPGWIHLAPACSLFAGAARAALSSTACGASACRAARWRGAGSSARAASTIGRSTALEDRSPAAPTIRNRGAVAGASRAHGASGAAPARRLARSRASRGAIPGRCARARACCWCSARSMPAPTGPTRIGRACRPICRRRPAAAAAIASISG